MLYGLVSLFFMAESEGSLCVLNDDLNFDSEEIVRDESNGLSAPALQDAEEEKSEKMFQLPLARIKHLMKMDPDVNLASQEAVFLITKATELFIESLAKEAYKFTAQAKKKTLQRRDIDSAIDSADCLAFLEGTLD